MTELTQALFRIDPTEGLVQYALAVKPYHSKILDVFVEYVYTESMSVRVSDHLSLEMTLTSGGEGEPVTYTCGYGYIWDISSGDTMTATVVSASPATSTFLVRPSKTLQYPATVTNVTTGQLTLVDTNSVPLQPEVVPTIPYGSAVTMLTTGLLPLPLQPATQYFLIPTTVLGVYNLSYVRYPTRFADYIKITTLGTGKLILQRSEPFVPGDPISISGTGANDGRYIVHTVSTAGSNYNIGVYQPIPILQGAIGVMNYSGTFGEAYCAPANAPALHTSAYITERLHFEFSDDPTTIVVNDLLVYDSPSGIDTPHRIDGLPHHFL